MAEETVAVLGTGTMGAPIARNLLKADFDVRVWNRTRAKAEPLGDAGATVCDSAAEAAAGAAFVLTPLVGGDEVREVMEEDRTLGAMDDDAVWLQVATVGISATEELAELAAERGVAYVDAPLLGTREPAEQGELIVLASGPEEVHDRCAPVLEAIGKQTRWVGEAGMATRLKLVINMWLLAVTGAAAEAIALAEGLGVDPRLFLETVQGSPIDTPYLQLKGEKILARKLEQSFKLRLAEKDADLVLEAGAEANVDLGLAKAARDAFARAVELGHGDEDMAAVYYATAREKSRR
jgi:3-hydroxyisobutyrate dehydrogenase